VLGKHGTRSKHGPFLAHLRCVVVIVDDLVVTLPLPLCDCSVHLRRQQSGGTMLECAKTLRSFGVYPDKHMPLHSVTLPRCRRSQRLCYARDFSAGLDRLIEYVRLAVLV